MWLLDGSRVHMYYVVRNDKWRKVYYFQTYEEAKAFAVKKKEESFASKKKGDDLIPVLLLQDADDLPTL